MRLFIRGSYTSFQTTRYSQSQLIKKEEGENFSFFLIILGLWSNHLLETITKRSKYYGLLISKYSCVENTDDKPWSYNSDIFFCDEYEFI